MCRFPSVVAVVLLALGIVAPSVAAAPIASSAFYTTWARTDQPVANGQVSRTWMWGPQADSGPLLEPYVESPGGQRLVQYFDKARMEITNPGANQSSLWYVTTGLLAEEMVTGAMQLGDTSFHQYAPAQVNVAGDLNDPNGPTYATFNSLMGAAPLANGATITQTVNRAGQVGSDASLASYTVTATDVGAPTKHTVASVFWAFMTSAGPAYVGGRLIGAPLFPNPFYATGYPLTEPYWTTVLVGGVSKQVLVQVFERRVLTYTPSNPSGWQVESGNVGLQYYQWRYVQLGLTPTPTPSQPTASGSGVYGLITAGPTCPVVRPGVECVPRPVSAEVDAQNAAGAVVASTQSDSSGRYSLSLAPGSYTLVVNTGATLPSCPDTPVTVPSGAPVAVYILCDTGIR